jgi:hypothetical protein
MRQHLITGWCTARFQLADSGPKDVAREVSAWCFPQTYLRIESQRRGELPLPPKAKPWTPYGLLNPPRRAEGRRAG